MKKQLQILHDLYIYDLNRLGFIAMPTYKKPKNKQFEDNIFFIPKGALVTYIKETKDRVHVLFEEKIRFLVPQKFTAISVDI